jgi:periplasmic protein TonB
MRGAVPLSVALHAGILGAVLLAGFAPSDEFEAESVAIDIVTLEVAVVTQPSTVPSEAVETLVSAGAEAAAPETLVADLAEPVAPMAPLLPVERAQPVKTAMLQPIETEDLSSAEILVASAVDAPDLEAVAPQWVAPDAVAVTDVAVQPSEPAPLDRLEVASIAPVTPAEPLDSAPPIRLAAIDPVDEVLTEAPMAPVPLPRLVRQETEREPEPAEKPAETRQAKPAAPKPKKPAEKPAPKPQQQASLGNGGADNADTQARKAASGGKGKKSDGGSGASSKYPGQVQVRVNRASRYPSAAKGSDGEAYVTFTVAANGGVSRLNLSRSSGNAALDDAALAAVERAAPFPPIPEDAGRSSWTFTVPVAFRK